MFVEETVKGFRKELREKYKTVLQETDQIVVMTHRPVTSLDTLRLLVVHELLLKRTGSNTCSFCFSRT